MSYLPSIARFRGITTGRIITLEATGGNETFDLTIDGTLYRTHVFTSPGSLKITRFSNVQEYNTIECFVVAGGGGGGNGENYINSNNGNGSGGGGGGGGGGIVLSSLILSPNKSSVPIAVGQGGLASTNGENSRVDSVIALGGGRGGGGDGGAIIPSGSTNPYNKGGDGGSGGGGGRYGLEGIGLQPAYTYPGFGNNGYRSTGRDGGGGGGAGSAASGRSGGGGKIYNLHSPSETNRNFSYGGTAGNMGGYSAGASAPANTGAGGNGGSGPHPRQQSGPSAPGGRGGSGIVVVRYPIEVV
jgi:hypothetical protein